MDHFYETRKIPLLTQKMPHFVVAIGTNLVHVTLQRATHRLYNYESLAFNIFNYIQKKHRQYSYVLGHWLLCHMIGPYSIHAAVLQVPVPLHLLSRLFPDLVKPEPCLPKKGTWNLAFYLIFAELPGAPESAEILDQSPTMVVLRVQPPLDYGGMPLLGYRVEYDGFMEEFDLGKLYCEGTIPDFELCKKYAFGLV